jgi:hypothetical protein
MIYRYIYIIRIHKNLYNYNIWDSIWLDFLTFFLLIHQAITYDLAWGWFESTLWMGQRNPNHQLIGGKHPMILLGFPPSQVQVQDFAGPSTVLNHEIFVGSTSPSDKVRFHIFGLAKICTLYCIHLYTMYTMHEQHSVDWSRVDLDG